MLIGRRGTQCKSQQGVGWHCWETPLCADGRVVGPSHANPHLAQGRSESLRDREALGVANIWTTSHTSRALHAGVTIVPEKSNH